MAPSRVKVFLFGAIACLNASVCLSEHPQKEETVFSVGHSSDKNPHSRASFFSRVPNLMWTNTGKSYEDPMIHMFGEGDDNGKIDLLLPGQKLNGEQVFSFWGAKPHLKQYTPAQSPSSISPSLAPPSPLPNSPPPVAPTPSPSAQPPSPLPPSASISPVSPSISPPSSYSRSPTSFTPSIAPSSPPYPFPPSPITPSPYLPPPIFPPSVSPPINPPSVLPPIFPPFPSVSPPTFPPSSSPSPYMSPPTLPPSSSSSPSLPPPIFPPLPPQLPPQSPSPSSSPTPSPAPTSLSPSPTPSVTPPQPFPSPTPTPSSPLPTPIPSPVPTPRKISILTNLIVPNGALLVPDFDPFVFSYKVSFGSNVRRFIVVAYLPEDDEDYKNLSLFIESVPLKSGEKSPPLKLGKRGETVTFHIYVRAVNHAPTTYVLSVTREAGHKGLGTVAIIFVVLACIVGALILMVFGNAAYFYARTGRMLQLRDFQFFRGRDSSLYTPLIASGVTNDDSRL